MKILNNLKLAAALFIVPIIGLSPLKTLAATMPINTGAKVSFSFDDGYSSAVTQAAPTLAKYGMTGTSYVISGCVGMTKAPNTCHADEDKTYMTWAQIQSLQNTYGWEIGSHTVDHYCLASNASIDPDDCQANTMTTAQVDAELANSKAALTANGLNVTDMSTPYGDYNQAVLKEISKYYASQRGFADTGYNAAPYNQYILRDQYADGPVSLATMEGYVNQAVASNQWLIFTFHDIQTKSSKHQYDYEWSTSDLDKLAAYVKAKTVPVVNVRDGLISGTNLLSNPSFDGGITGWSTDTPSNVVLDTGNNGSYPSSTNSVAMTATTKDAHLFSPKVSVTPGSTYLLQSFMNITKLASGSLSYYIDEYNSNGTWISGQYKQGVSFPWPQNAGFTYVPTSANVASASLQVVTPANSGIQAYLDNFQWLLLNGVTPPPVQTNLMPNGTFDAGISQGWTTDGSANILADSGNNGSPANPENSVKMTATAVNKHLFAPKITLASGKTYNVSTYINIKQLTSGEVGFYIDEYDAGGNWISGQYITGDRAVGTSTVSFNYTPTSMNVKSASLQIILVGNSGIVAYVDNVAWVQN
jgi:peptidoglycan/xylan/chitin deacetylase (PgdA/CDA1 family)